TGKDFSNLTARQVKSDIVNLRVGRSELPVLLDSLTYEVSGKIEIPKNGQVCSCSRPFIAASLYQKLIDNKHYQSLSKNP
ncbi:MAG TPA: hypothetical protein PKK69_09595, partial [Ferruginibacter sp.]|nr:hypothetical protein [Ferruginibacter sp.]